MVVDTDTAAAITAADVATAAGTTVSGRYGGWLLRWRLFASPQPAVQTLTACRSSGR